VLDVVEAKIAKRLPDRIIEDVIALQAQYRCQAWAVESVQYQEFLRTELVKRGAARGVPVPAVPVTPHRDKALRIEALQPHVLNGLIRVHPSQTMLLQQLRHWPKGDHDDGPDALEMLWSLALQSGGFALPMTSGIKRSMSRVGALHGF
jgi:predicted phage terminase large subunit-like protein